MSTRWMGYAAALVVVMTAGCKDEAASAAAGGPAAPAAVVTPAAAPAIAMVVLVEGHGEWLGFEDDQGRIEGFRASVDDALTALAAAGPQGSEAAVLIYSEDVQVVRPFGDIRTLGTALDAPRRGLSAQRDLHVGLARALDELQRHLAPRKVLVVIGDGADTYSERPIAPSATKLKDAGIEVYTIYLAAEGLEPTAPDAMKQLGHARAFTMNWGSGLAPTAAEIVKALAAPR